MAQRETALGVARTRFVQGLGRRRDELRGALAALKENPEGVAPREDVRRRLHALYASAQVFRVDGLARALQHAIARLDAARDEERPVAPADLEMLSDLASRLPELGGADDPEGKEDPSGEAPGGARERDAGGEGTPRKPASASTPPTEAGPAERASPQGTDGPTQPYPVQQSFESETARQPSPSAHEPAAFARRARPSGTFTTARSTPSSSSAEATAGSPDGDSPPSETPGIPLDAVLSVLVAGEVETQTQVRALLPAERFELLTASDVDAALRTARASAPDIVLADETFALGTETELVSRLRSDPLTDFVPVVVIFSSGKRRDPMALREAGADEGLLKPLDAAMLQHTIARLTGTLPSGGGALDELGDVTLDELADLVGEEIRRGLVDAAESGRQLRIPMGQGSEVLAATWAAIARIRAHAAHRSGGRVRFRDTPRRGGPALMALVDDAGAQISDPDDAVDLSGRRVLVADDEPAVVWFFAGVLREEGAEVVEADDGQAALEAARNRRPDVIVTDILMPRLDGFELCRELERDPALAEVPVVLLSWKEDFLQRMRELRSGARGYLRKEAGSAQIVAQIREVLRPRERLEAQLRAGGEVRGRVEGVGMLTLLRSVAASSPDARVIVRDAWNLFEGEMRSGQLVDLTRTATDGSFVRGPRALPQLLGVTAGRFTVVRSDAPTRTTFQSSLEDALNHATSELGAVLDAVSGEALSQATSVQFHEEILDTVLQASPGHVRRLVDRLREGSSPRHMLFEGEVAPQVLESVLVDLARRGALARVEGPEGEDRIADAWRARRQSSPRDEAAEQATPRADEAMEPAAPAEGREETPELPPRDHVGQTVEAPAEAPADARVAAPQPEAGHPRMPPLPTPSSGSDPEPSGASNSPAPDAAAGAGSRDNSPRHASASPTNGAHVHRADARAQADDEEERGPGLLGWVFLLVVFAVLGFAGWRLMGGASRSPATGERNLQSKGEIAAGPIGRAPAGAAPDGGSERRPDSPKRGGGERARDEAKPEGGEAGALGDLSFGRTLDRIVDAGVHVPPDHGLLVVEAAEDGVRSRVRVGDHDLGKTPIHVPLAEGRHRLVFRRDAETDYRYIHVQAGKTRVVRAP